MKKLLNVLAVVTVVTPVSSSVAACGYNCNNSQQNDSTNVKVQMISGAKFMTQLILAGRHENLNYNVNEVLSAYITPYSTILYIPTKYSYNDKIVDVSKAVNAYKTLLAPGMANFDQDNYAGYYASYVMGMYNDDFYQQFVTSSKMQNSGYFLDTMDKDGNYGVNKPDKNALGFAAGLSSDIQLDQNQDRRDLAWGIQDTGALSNYLLNKGFDGGWPGDTNGAAVASGTGSATNGGTNSGGYLFYNSITAAGKAKVSTSDFKAKKLNEKFTDSNISLQYNNPNVGNWIPPYLTKMKNATLVTDGTKQNFGETGARITEVASNLNVQGHAIRYTALVDGVSETESGAQLLGQLLDVIFPIFKQGGLFTDQSKGFAIVKNVLNALFGKNGYNDNVKNALSTLGVPTDLLNKGDSIATGSGGTIADLFKGIDAAAIKTMAADARDILESIVKTYNGQTDTIKTVFAKTMLANDGIIGKEYQSIRSAIGEESWNKTMGVDTGYGGGNKSINNGG